MSRIDDLIAEHCPDGVAFYELQELFTTKGGYTPSKADAAAWTDATVPWFRMEDIRENGRILDNSLQHINQAAVKGGRLFPANSILVATSATIGEHALIKVPHLSNQRFTSLTLKPNYADRFDIKFVFYYCFVLDEWCKNNTTTSSFASVDMAGFKKFKFPVPPLAIQREIAAILDTMESLKAELEAELELRSRQYAFYRDSLLTFAERERVRWATLSEVATFKYGYTASAATEGDYRFIRITDIDTNGKLRPENAKYVEASEDAAQYLVKRGDLLMARTGATYGKTVLVEEETDAVYASFLIRIHLDESAVLPGYYWHFAQSGMYWEQANALVSTGGQPQFNANVLKTVRIPIPPLEEQQRVVSILDKFDALVNDLSVGLPAEISARQAQYEYYRDKLLTFEEAAA